MKTLTRQKGAIATLYLVLIGLAVIAAMGTAIYFSYESLLKKNKELSDTIASQKVTIESLEKTNAEFEEKNRQLNKTIETINQLNEIDAQEREKREKYIRDLEKQVKILSAKLPTVLSDDMVCKQTDAELKNSAQRIEYIWSIFHIDYGLIANPVIPVTPVK